MPETQRLAPEDLFSAIEELISTGCKASFTVTGMSMWPFICHERDQVVVEACDTESLNIGDIVLFQTPMKNYMLHRITGLREGSFETTGDGNCFRDGWFSRKCIRARVVEIIRNKRHINCQNFLWRTIFALWRRLFPVRRLLLSILMETGYLKARLRQWLSKLKKT